MGGLCRCRYRDGQTSGCGGGHEFFLVLVAAPDHAESEHEGQADGGPEDVVLDEWCAQCPDAVADPRDDCLHLPDRVTLQRGGPRVRLGVGVALGADEIGRASCRERGGWYV